MNNKMHRDVQSAVFITYVKQMKSGTLSPEDQIEVGKIMDATSVFIHELMDDLADLEQQVAECSAALSEDQIVIAKCATELRFSDAFLNERGLSEQYEAFKRQQLGG